MDFSINASITPSAAAKLLISGEIDVDEAWTPKTASKVLDALLDLSIDDILKVVDCNKYGEIAEIKKIPQFGKIETIINVPSYFVNSSSCCADYPQLGLFLKRDPNATLTANYKYGENHGKVASLLGITSCVNSRITPSALTFAFVALDYDEKEEIVKRLLFRMPIMQIILSSAKKGKVNGYDSMALLSKSTKIRRGDNLRAVFNVLKEYNNADLSARIDNVDWLL